MRGMRDGSGGGGGVGCVDSVDIRKRIKKIVKRC